MAIENEQNIFEKVARLLRQQQEMYGNFEVDLKRPSKKEVTAKSVVSEPQSEYDSLKELSIEEQLDFRVFLNDNEIGYHSVQIRRTPQGAEVSVDASFDVKILFFNAFSYRHSAEERWNGTPWPSTANRWAGTSDRKREGRRAVTLPNMRRVKLLLR